MTTPLTVVLFAVLLGAIWWLSRRTSLSVTVLVALLAGAAFGSLVQFGVAPSSLPGVLSWLDLIGGGYVQLLKMIVMPLVLVMMFAAVLQVESLSAIGRMGGIIVAVLVGLTVVAGAVGAFTAAGFQLSAEGLTETERELARAAVLVERQETVAALDLPTVLRNLLPTNIFADLTGARGTSIIAVVIFAILLGIAGLALNAHDPARGADVKRFAFTARDLVLQLVRLIIALTPYGVAALFADITATADWNDILELGWFVVASYCAIAVMFAVHAGVIATCRINPVAYFRDSASTFAFAFSSRSSAATIPLTIETQIKQFGVRAPIANLSASLGATIGQNGCAGVYPAMLATMIAPTLGVDPLAPSFLVGMLGIIAISSFGVAGVGGGATFAALIVLPALGFPVTLAALLISVEPLIDMARTALNVSGAMVAGIVSERILPEEAGADIGEIERTATIG